MEFIGFSEETTKWFKSCLLNRKLKLHIKNTFLGPENLLCGVPQCKLYTTSSWLWTIGICWWHLIFQHEYITKIEKAINKNFNMLCDWFVDNKLSIYFCEDKTKSIKLRIQNH